VKETEDKMVKAIQAAQAVLPPGCVVVLLVAPPTEAPGSRINYIANASREQIAKAMKEMVQRFEQGDRGDPPAPL
jgi:hypothetical protein